MRGVTRIFIQKEFRNLEVWLPPGKPESSYRVLIPSAQRSHSQGPGSGVRDVPDSLSPRDRGVHIHSDVMVSIRDLPN